MNNLIQGMSANKIRLKCFHYCGKIAFINEKLSNIFTKFVTVTLSFDNSSNLN